ncbi:MAG: nuclear transport factor 2 family protein [Solirubrobacterales bacterium]
MSEDNVEIARRGFEAALRGDIDAIGEILDPEVKWHGGERSDPTACHNREQALEAMRQARLRRQNIGELVDVIGAGEKVVVIIRPPSGDGEKAAPIANLTTFRHGKAIEMIHYPEPKEALAAAGL